jgi:hypothetical protein
VALPQPCHRHVIQYTKARAHAGRVTDSFIRGRLVENIVSYRVVDYQSTDGDWRNTDPKGSVTTDGSRMGQGDSEPTVEDIESSPWINVGFEDADGDVHYKWIKGPFDEDFWVDEAIEQIVDEYGIVLGESA